MKPQHLLRTGLLASSSSSHHRHHLSQRNRICKVERGGGFLSRHAGALLRHHVGLFFPPATWEHCCAVTPQVRKPDWKK